MLGFWDWDFTVANMATTDMAFLDKHGYQRD